MTLPLAGLDILVVEDHYFVARELADVLEKLGADVIGPVARFPLDSCTASKPVDVALLDVAIGDGTSFALADEMQNRGVPVALITGYEAHVLPAHYRALPRLEKPVDCGKLTAAVLRLAGRIKGADA